MLARVCSHGNQPKIARCCRQRLLRAMPHSNSRNCIAAALPCRVVSCRCAAVCAHARRSRTRTTPASGILCTTTPMIESIVCISTFRLQLLHSLVTHTHTHTLSIIFVRLGTYYITHTHIRCLLVTTYRAKDRETQHASTIIKYCSLHMPNRTTILHTRVQSHSCSS